MTAVAALTTLTSPVRSADAEPTFTILDNGAPNNRVDLAVVGEGYTAAEQGKFATDVDQAITAMFSQEPFAEYKGYFNVHRIDVVSAQPGADHPERSPPVAVNTAFDATYNCAGVVRLICLDEAKVLTVIGNNLPPHAYDLQLVIVNDVEYGGAGGVPAVASTDSRTVELVLHELGHSFGALTDEYGIGPNNPSCQDTEPIEPNATRATARASIKWSAWIDPSTAIPTGGVSAGVPGLYEGAAYCDIGVYRPTFNSKMRSLGAPYEQVNTEQLVMRIYNLVSPIDASEPTAATVPYVAGGTQRFRVAPMPPATHSLSVSWSLDGRVVATTTEMDLSFSTLSPGTHTITVVVHDPTAMVRVDPNDLLRESRSWTIRAPARTVNDYNGDGATDIGVFRLSTGTWFLQDGPTTAWGTSGDAPVPGDYDANGSADEAVFRPSSGVWFVHEGAAVSWGTSGDIPVPGDYDANGSADVGVFRPSSGVWFVRGGGSVAWGTSGDIPVPGDYNGDGSTDFAVFRPSNGTWFVRGGVVAHFGTSGDVPVPGDYDGNGSTDIAVFRPSNGLWFVLGGTTAAWGASGDVPVPGDYDGNGSTDIAVFRPSNGLWFTLGGTTTPWGTSGDHPLPLPTAIGQAFFP